MNSNGNSFFYSQVVERAEKRKGQISEDPGKIEDLGKIKKLGKLK